MGSQVRTDTQKGAFPSGLLPPWATQALLAPGTWDNVPSTNTVQSLGIQTLPTSSGSGLTYYAELFNWDGAAMSYEYSAYGALIHFGGGHASAIFSNLSNGVLAWNLDTGLWEVVIPAWYDTSQIPNPLNWTNPSGIAWNGTGASSTWFQKDVELNARAEYAAGIPAASHSYSALQIVPSQWGGASKGSLVKMGALAPGSGGENAQPSQFPDPFKSFTQCYLHEADLTAKAWKRYCNPGAQEVARGGSGASSGFSPTCFDNNRGKIYYLNLNFTIPGAITPNPPQCTPGICVADCTTRTTTVCPLTGAQQAGGSMIPNQTGMAFVPHPTDPLQDVLVHWTGTALHVAWANWIATHVPTINGVPVTPQNGGDATAGFKTVAMSGTPISTGGQSGGFGFDWCPDLNPDPANPYGSICALDRNPGQPTGQGGTANPPTIYKLQVPSNRMNGTWNWTSEALTKASAGNNQPNDWNNQAQQWSKWRYARTAKCFLLCDTEALPMRMFRPTGLV